MLRLPLHWVKTCEDKDFEVEKNACERELLVSSESSFSHSSVSSPKSEKTSETARIRTSQEVQNGISGEK